MTNIKTSHPQENKNIDDDVFVLINKCILKGDLSLNKIHLQMYKRYISINTNLRYLVYPFGPNWT